MHYTTLGKTGEKISEMCLGTMMFGGRADEAESRRIMDMAIDHGVTFIDTAAMYGDGRTEEIVGRCIHGKRDGLFITTKVHKGVDAKTIRESINQSLARMQLDYVDLYLIHWPKVGMAPPEIMEALDTVVKEGKTRYVGCSNYPAWLFAYSNTIALLNDWAPLVCNQVVYNLVERGIEVEILPQALTEGIAITVYRPLLMGVLTGKYQVGGELPPDTRGQNDQRVSRWLDKYGQGIQRFNQFAADHGLHPAQLAIAWVRYSPAVTSPIVGASSALQLDATLKAFDFNLSPEEYAEVTGMFDTAVKEESGGPFPQLRRQLDLVKSSVPVG